MSAGKTKVDIINFYNNQLEYMKSYESGKNGRLRRVKSGLSRLITPDMSVLDVGCGTGITSRHMAEHGAKVTGVDISPLLIQYANQKSNGLNITYLVQDVHDLDIDDTFDMIVLVDVFEHFIREDVFGNIHRLLRHNAHDKTRVYLNMPTYTFSLFMAKHYRDKMQIIDEAWKTEDVISLFAYCGFMPCTMQVYGVDAIAQYIEYLFVPKPMLEDMYDKRLKQLYQQAAYV